MLPKLTITVTQYLKSPTAKKYLGHHILMTSHVSLRKRQLKTIVSTFVQRSWQKVQASCSPGRSQHKTKKLEAPKTEGRETDGGTISLRIQQGDTNDKGSSTVLELKMANHPRGIIVHHDFLEPFLGDLATLRHEEDRKQEGDLYKL